MKGPLLAAAVLAFIPGLCDKPEDPSKGIPPEVWKLRQVMEREVTRDGDGERVSADQAQRMRDAADEVFTFENVRNPDIAAEVLYLLPRTWHWDQRQILRDLLVLLCAGKAGPALQAEALTNGETEMRKQVMLTLIATHTEMLKLSPAERVEKILASAQSGAWNAPKYGWKADLLFRYGTMVLARHPAEGAAPLVALAAKPGPLRDWALRTLPRIADPKAVEALRGFYREASAPARPPAPFAWDSDGPPRDDEWSLIRFRGRRIPIATCEVGGAKYALYVCSELGGPEDVWIARLEGSLWSGRVTGLSGFLAAAPLPLRGAIAANPDGMLAIALTAGRAPDGAPGELKATVSWEALGADADGDGLTDLAEGRLGTDPGEADTDGDGEPDGSDRNPLARPGPGDDAAQVREAALRYWADLAALPADRTAVVQVEGAPLALDAGAGRVLVVDAAGWKGWCERVGRPACGLRIGVSDGIADRAPLLVEGDRATVILTSDGGPARTLSIAFRLIRVGGLWVVTDWQRIR